MPVALGSYRIDPECLCKSLVLRSNLLKVNEGLIEQSKQPFLGVRFERVLERLLGLPAKDSNTDALPKLL